MYILLVPIAVAAVAFGIIWKERGLPETKSEWFMYGWLSLVCGGMIILLKVYSEIMERER